MIVSNEDVETALKAYFGQDMYALARGANAPRRSMRAALETLPPPDLPWRVSDIQRGLILFRTSNNAHGSINYEALTFKIMELPKLDQEELVSSLRALANSIEAALKPDTGE